MLLGMNGRTPAGYSNSIFAASINYWTDRWLTALPNTKQAIMVNYIGGNLGENASAYAAGKGVYLQQNSPNLSSGSVALFTANASKTKIIIDADDACTAATGTAFDALITKIFGFGTPLDYVLLCYKSFSDPATAAKLPDVISRLRGNGTSVGGDAPATTTPVTTTPVTPPADDSTKAPATTYRTDFTGTTMPDGWSFVNPVGNSTLSFTTTPGHARIVNPNGQAHDCWWNVTCTRLMRAVDNTDHTFETRIDGVNLASASQSYGILVWQDSTHFIRFEFWTQGNGVHAAAWSVNGASLNQAILGPTITLGASNSLRVTRTGDRFTLQYSTNGGSTWQNAGSYTQAMTVTQVGMHVINSPTPSTTANFDYFQIQ
jgi:regulation of enolase protein 1 (concanavalin A-like superfamily)